MEEELTFLASQLLSFTKINNIYHYLYHLVISPQGQIFLDKTFLLEDALFPCVEVRCLVFMSHYKYLGYEGHNVNTAFMKSYLSFLPFQIFSGSDIMLPTKFSYLNRGVVFKA